MSHTAGRPSRLIDTTNLLNHVCLRMCVLEQERERESEGVFDYIRAPLWWQFVLERARVYFNEFKITIGVYESEMTHGGTESICVYRHNTHTKMGDTHTYTHPASEPLAVLLQSVWSSVSREAIGLWQCFTHSNTHWLPGKEGLQREKADRGDSRRSVSAQTHSSSSHPFLQVCRSSENRLRLFTATLPFPLGAHTLISRSLVLTPTGWDWNSALGDAARILPRLHQHQTGRLAVSFRGSLN